MIMAVAFGAPWITLVALKDIAAEVRGERSIPAFASALMWIGSGVGGILMGRIAERIGIRFTVIFGAVMVALGLALSSFGPSLPLYIGHGLFMGLHNHSNLSDPDALNNEASFVKGLALSPGFRAVLDIRHYTAANGDCVAFLEKHHAGVAAIHLGDRRKNNGRSTPFGEGDAPIIQILRMIRDNQWPIVALLEFEHGTLRPEVEEVQLMFDYCRRALA